MSVDVKVVQHPVRLESSDVMSTLIRGAMPACWAVVVALTVSPAVLRAEGAGGFSEADLQSLLRAGPSVIGQQQVNVLVSTALNRSPAVREATFALQAARLDVDEAAGARYPQVALDVDSKWSQGVSEVQGRELGGRIHYSLTASMPVFSAGRISRFIESKSANELAAQARLRGVMQSVAGESILAATEVTRFRLQVAAADRYMVRIQSLVDMLSKIATEDPGRAGELTQARSRVLQAQLARANLASRGEQAEVVLRKWVGPGDYRIDQVGFAFIDMPGLDVLIDKLSDHPAVVQAGQEAAAQKSFAQSVAAAQMPQVSLVASQAPVFPGLSGHRATYAGVNVSYALFKGFSGQAAERSAIERAAAASEREGQVMTDRQASLRALYGVVRGQLSRAQDYADLLTESDQVRKGFFDQWRELGRRSLFELLAAENEHFSLQGAYLDTLFDALAGLTRLRVDAGYFPDWYDGLAR